MNLKDIAEMIGALTRDGTIEGLTLRTSKNWNPFDVYWFMDANPQVERMETPEYLIGRTPDRKCICITHVDAKLYSDLV